MVGSRLVGHYFDEVNILTGPVVGHVTHSSAVVLLEIDSQVCWVLLGECGIDPIHMHLGCMLYIDPIHMHLRPRSQRCAWIPSGRQLFDSFDCCQRESRSRSCLRV